MVFRKFYLSYCVDAHDKYHMHQCYDPTQNIKNSKFDRSKFSGSGSRPWSHFWLQGIHECTGVRVTMTVHQLLLILLKVLELVFIYVCLSVCLS